jgi:excisionase family DNA binding protein
MYEKLLKGGDVAAILNISRSKAYRLMQTGDIPSVRIGHSVRVRPCDLVSFIEQNIRSVNKVKLPAGTGSHITTTQFEGDYDD